MKIDDYLGFLLVAIALYMGLRRIADSIKYAIKEAIQYLKESIDTDANANDK